MYRYFKRVLLEKISDFGPGRMKARTAQLAQLNEYVRLKCQAAPETAGSEFGMKENKTEILVTRYIKNIFE